jgi:hypothetical protein
MPTFLLYAAFFLAISLAGFLGLVALATSRSKEKTRRVVRRLALGLAILGAAVYGYLVVLLLDAHFDTEDFWSSPEEAQLQKYAEACEGPLAPGTTVADVHAWLKDEGILAARDPNRDRDKRVYFREDINLERKIHVLEIRDRNVRNWNTAGDIDVTTYITFEGPRVSRCEATIFRHGR